MIPLTRCLIVSGTLLTLSACTQVERQSFLIKVDGQTYDAKSASSYTAGSSAKDGDVWQVTVGKETAFCAEPTIEACVVKIRELVSARKAGGFPLPKPADPDKLPGLAPPLPVIVPTEERSPH